MATKLTSLISIVTGYFSNTQINSNFQTIATEFDKVVYRDGTTPNTMSADLDLNSKDLLNVAQTNTDTLYVAGTKVTATTASPSWKGPWVTATVYAIDDIVSTSGSSYICIVAHTAAATFTADLSAVKWQVMASVGATGAGTGDLLAASNLSDVADATTARANLGAEIGVNVQAYDAVLQDLSAITPVAGDTYYHDGANLVKLAKGTSGYVLTQGATNPAWATPAPSANTSAPSVIVEGYNDTTGTLTATTWTDCHFSNLVQNTISASLASHRVTLPAGTYYIDTFVKIQPGSGGVMYSSLRLYDHTNTAIIAEYITNQGQLDYSPGAFCGANVFTLSAPAAIAFQVYKNSGAGNAQNALVKIWKTA